MRFSRRVSDRMLRSVLHHKGIFHYFFLAAPWLILKRQNHSVMTMMYGWVEQWNKWYRMQIETKLICGKLCKGITIPNPNPLPMSLRFIHVFIPWAMKLNFGSFPVRKQNENLRDRERWTMRSEKTRTGQINQLESLVKVRERRMGKFCWSWIDFNAEIWKLELLFRWRISFTRCEWFTWRVSKKKNNERSVAQFNLKVPQK